ncbi:MAG: glycosyltransferase family 4 protein [Gammaproteobacteria bacterium]|nr:glycosyltransferase family 4 protein [Gammaproteobacteria bacterium]
MQSENPLYSREVAVNPEPDVPSRLPPIAICSVGELFGGVERHILGALSGLKAHSMHHPVLLLFHDGELAALAREMGVEPIILPLRNRSLWTTSRLLARILEQQQVRLVHVHGYKATVFCALARQWYHLPIIRTEHGLPEPMADSPVRALRDNLYHLLERMATRSAVATVCYVTKDLLTHYQRAYCGLRAMVIPNGVVTMHPSQFLRPFELRDGCLNLVLAGRLNMVKGHHLAIEAITVKGLSNAQLYIIGVGPREAELRALADARGVGNRVHFLGFRRNIYGYIAHCDIMLMPSLHEGLPYTLLEAMAVGTPIVASRVGGLAEVIEHGVSGLLIPPGDVMSLAKAIVRLKDPVLRRFLGNSARHLQQTQYSLEAMTERYIVAYRELVFNDG